MNANRAGRLGLLLVVVAVQLGIPRPAAGAIHYMIVSPLLRPGQHLSSKDSFEINLSTDMGGLADFILFPQNSVPEGYSAPLNAEYFATSGPVAFVDDQPFIAKVSFASGPSYAMLRFSGAKAHLDVEVARADLTMGTAFVFPLGEPGQRAKVYIANPSTLGTIARVRFGLPAAIPQYIEPVAPWGVQAVVLDPSYRNTRVQVDSDNPVIVMLETIDSQGNISRTIIPPG